MSGNQCENSRNCDTESDNRAAELRFCETLSPKESEKVVKLSLADWGDKRGKPLAAEELFEIGREVFEPLFHEPPLGPIPEYLKPHSSVHACVTEYEEKLENLERWKVDRLNLWLKDKVGKSCRAGGKVYELCMKKEEAGAPDKYWFGLSEDKS
jgi:hypothetical protein